VIYEGSMSPVGRWSFVTIGLAYDDYPQVVRVWRVESASGAARVLLEKVA
jgi:hypothetical protein